MASHYSLLLALSDRLLFSATQICLCMREQNHNLCCFFYKFCQISTISIHLLVPNLVTLAQLVVRLPGRQEVLGSNPY